MFVVLPGLALGCRAKDASPDAPKAFEAKTTVELTQRFRCIDVFDLPETSGVYKALVFKLPKAGESDSDYRVVFYKRAHDSFVRDGAESNLVNFEQPKLSVGPASPRLETTQRRLGVKFHYQMGPNGFDLVPSEKNDDGTLKGHPKG